MPILLKLIKGIVDQVRHIGWLFLMALFIGHMITSYAAMSFVGEEKLVEQGAFPYYYIVTATTIGYGDFSPQTFAGRWVAILYLIPGSIGLFAALIGKTTSLLIGHWRRSMKGKLDYSTLESHTVIIGWHGDKTEKIVSLLLDDQSSRSDKIVLCVTDEIENPLPDKALFVRSDSFAQPNLLKRAGISTAERILIYGNSDEQTLATAFAVLAQDPMGHVVVHFNDESLAKLLNTHYPKAECTRSLSIDLLVRAAQDPGISLITTELLSVASGPAEYSLRVPVNINSLAFGHLLLPFKQKYDAILMGIGKASDEMRPILNPTSDETIKGGDTLYYLANMRLEPARIDWEILQRGASC